MGDLTKNFSIEEFKCFCGCGTFNVDEDFLHKLQNARTMARIPFHINSGCRCGTHNKLVGGKPTSGHLASDGLQCCAADIACYDVCARYLILDAAIISGLNRIGIGKNFLHLGLKGSEKAIWLYS